MFITEQDLTIPPYFIPNSVELQDGTVQDQINEYEEAELRLLLGDILYDQLILGLAVLPTPDVWWTRLRDGFAYSYQDKQYVWKGLAWMLKPFIWFMLMRENETKKTRSGASLARAENAENVSLAKELCLAYNEYARRSGFEGCRNQVSSLYGFLKSDLVNYVDWVDGSEVEYINHYGL